MLFLRTFLANIGQHVGSPHGQHPPQEDIPKHPAFLDPDVPETHKQSSDGRRVLDSMSLDPGHGLLSRWVGHLVTSGLLSFLTW